jgi:serine/threonine protein phosphatase PrpC
VATSTCAGDQAVNADAVAAAHFATAGTVAAVVLDGKGTSEETANTMTTLAHAAALGAVRWGALNGLRHAGWLIADPGHEFVKVDGVGVLAVVRPGAPVTVVHVGRCRVYGWSRERGLELLTEDLTSGRLARNQGVPEHEAVQLDRFQRVTLARSSVGTIPAATTDDHLGVLTSDGVHAPLGDQRLADLIAAHQEHGPRVLADRLLAAALDHGPVGARDNASVVVLDAHPASNPSSTADEDTPETR